MSLNEWQQNVAGGRTFDTNPAHPGTKGSTWQQTATARLGGGSSIGNLKSANRRMAQRKKTEFFSELLEQAKTSLFRATFRPVNAPFRGSRSSAPCLTRFRFSEESESEPFCCLSPCVAGLRPVAVNSPAATTSCSIVGFPRLSSDRRCRRESRREPNRSVFEEPSLRRLRRPRDSSSHPRTTGGEAWPDIAYSRSPAGSRGLPLEPPRLAP
jgi:hypothetical protein